MPGVIVTGGDTRAALATVRSLAAAGHGVAVVGQDRFGLALWSRAASLRRRAPAQDGPVAQVRSLWETGRYSAVVPGTDDDLLALARAFGETGRPPGIPTAAAAERSLDRRALAEAAGRAGVGEPVTVLCDSDATLTAALTSLGLPVMVKPIEVVVLDGSLGLARRASIRAADADAARAAAASIGWPVLAQAFVTGSTWSVAGVSAGGELLAHATSQYVRTWPPTAGNASASITVAAPSALVAATASIVAELGVDGLFELELVEGRDGHLAAIDMNPRPYGSLALAIRAGADLPVIWLDWLLHGRVPAATVVARPGVRYRWEEAELRNAFSNLRDREVGSLLRLARPRRDTAHAVAALRDPGPAFARCLTAARSLSGRFRH